MDGGGGGGGIKEIATHNILLWRRHTATSSSAILSITISPIAKLPLLYFLPNHTTSFHLRAFAILSHSSSVSKAFPEKLVFYSHCTQRSTPPPRPVSSCPATTALQTCHPRSPRSYSLWSCHSAIGTAPSPPFPGFHWLLAPAATLSLAKCNLQSAVPLAFCPPHLTISKTCISV